MTECLVLEMQYYNKLVIVPVIYRSPNQPSQEFSQFEMLISQILSDITSKNSFFSIILEDFSVGTKCWWGLDTESKESESELVVINN